MEIQAGRGYYEFRTSGKSLSLTLAGACAMLVKYTPDHAKQTDPLHRLRQQHHYTDHLSQASIRLTNLRNHVYSGNQRESPRANR